MDTPSEPHQIDLNTRVKRIDQQQTADLVGELAILNLKTGKYYGLDEVGTRIWALLKDSRTVQEIRDAVLQEYDVEPSRCEVDLLRLLNDLKEHELIEICSAPDRPI
jgi:hypothetical protein